MFGAMIAALVRNRNAFGKGLSREAVINRPKPPGFPGFTARPGDLPDTPGMIPPGGGPPNGNRPTPPTPPTPPG